METDNDLVAACKKKLLQFRVKELKDVLSQVGLSKQGKKQDLIDRILALLYDEGTPGLFKNNVKGKEGLVEIIDVTYRNMQEAVASDSNTKKHNSSSSSRLRPKEEVDESYQLERKLRCPCGSDLPSGAPLVQCVDSGCNVWQHISCVIIPERPMEKIPTPTQFLCETCRVKRADPFWAAMAHPLYPVKLVPSSIPVDGTNPHVSVEKIFKLTKADRDLLQKSEYGAQVWCMLLNDSVPFRIQWPLYTDLQVNGNHVKTVSRPSSQPLGANGRDDGAKIASFIVEGANKISLTFTDARSFCFGVRLVRKRTLEQVFGMIPKENDGEPFEDALARIHRCIGGGITTGNDDSDSDLEVIADFVPVSLRCPMSGSRMKTAGRFRPCAHMGCFDLDTFVGINERSRKWQCPICLKNYSLEQLIVDPFFNRILHMLGSCAEEINEIDMKPNGSWRVKKAREAGDLAKWHRPDGSIDELSRSDTGKEHALECNTLTLAMKNSVVDASPMNQGNNEPDNQVLDIISMSSTTSGNGVFNSNEPEVSSVLKRFGQNSEINDQNSGFPATNADIIVLSDSEDDDDVSLVYPETVPVVNTFSADAPTEDPPASTENCIEIYPEIAVVANTFSADTPTEGPPASSRNGFEIYPEVVTGNAFSADTPTHGPPVSSRNCVEHLTSQSSFPLSLEACGIGHFDNSGAFSNDYHSVSPTIHNNRKLLLQTSMDPVSHVTDSCGPQNSGFDHELPSVDGDIGLDARTCPSVSRDELTLVNSNGHVSSSNNLEAHHEPACETSVDLQNIFSSKEDSFIQRTEGDSGSLSQSESLSDPILKRKRCEGPFSFPRQKRSPRRPMHRAASSSIL